MLRSWHFRHAAIFHIEKQKIAYKCGGTVLNSNTILTAAHCVYENNRPIISERVLVQLGKYNLKVAGGHTQEFQVFLLIVEGQIIVENLLCNKKNSLENPSKKILKCIETHEKIPSKENL